MSMLIARANGRPRHELIDSLPGRSREAALSGRDPELVAPTLVERVDGDVVIEVSSNP